MTRPKNWLVTGAAGFIGSNLVERLLRSGQRVRGLDNFSTGHKRNLIEVRRLVGDELMRNFDFVKADIRDPEACWAAVQGQDFVLHQAALGSVPRSIADPLASHGSNVTGFINLLEAARKAGVKRFVYAASSSTYGDERSLPKVEHRIGKPLSPYAATKLVNEIYAEIYGRTYGLRTTGLRYFNVFGPRQDPAGPYAAVIPKWVAAMLSHDPVYINGDGETSRDFCYIENVVQANLLAATSERDDMTSVYNVAVGDTTSLNSLFQLIREGLAAFDFHYTAEPIHQEFRPGDVRHSLADISRACAELGYRPTHDVRAGLVEALPWYVREFERARSDHTRRVDQHLSQATPPS